MSQGSFLNTFLMPMVMMMMMMMMVVVVMVNAILNACNSRVLNWCRDVP